MVLLSLGAADFILAQSQPSLSDDESSLPVPEGNAVPQGQAAQPSFQDQGSNPDSVPLTNDGQPFRDPFAEESTPSVNPNGGTPSQYNSGTPSQVNPGTPSQNYGATPSQVAPGSEFGGQPPALPPSGQQFPAQQQPIQYQQQQPADPSAPIPGNLPPGGYPQNSLTPSPDGFTPSPNYQQGQQPAYGMQPPALPPSQSGLAPAGTPSPNSWDQGVTPSPQPRRDFRFPSQPADDDAPISQEVQHRQGLQQDTSPGTWSVGALGGFALNVNRRPQQFHAELHGGYRLFRSFELGLSTSFRVKEDKLIGFTLTGDYIYRLTQPPRVRIDLLFGAGLGLTLRAVKTFNEQRIAGRLHAGGLFYLLPRWALSTDLIMESFFMSFKDGKTTNFFKGKGMPTQLIIGVGARFEF